MKLALYSTDLPSGNAVALAMSISKATGIGASEAMQLAMKLFGGEYQSKNALELALTDNCNVKDLVDRCNEFGIHVRRQ